MTGETLLYRQVHPSWVQHDGRVTSQVFKPTPKDNRRLSVYDGDLITASEAWQHYTGRGNESFGVLALTVSECRSQELPVESDPAEFPSHAVIRFDDCPHSEIEKKAKYLKRAAEARGWKYLMSTIN
jgi:hypothetical protein